MSGMDSFGEAAASGPTPAAPDRVVAQAIRNLPSGLEALPAGPDDVAAIAGLIRAVDIAGCGHTSTNIEEVNDMLEAPDCRWAHGCATVWRGDDLVGALVVSDGLSQHRGWMVDVYCKPGDPRAHGINGALIEAGVREGRTRFDLRFPDPDEPMQDAKAGAYANDGGLRADLEERGFVEVRRYWRMTVDHWSMDTLAEGGMSSGLADQVRSDTAALAAHGYVMRPFRDVEPEWRAVHATHSASFLDHFDFTPIDYETWRGHHSGQTEDPTQWLVVEHEGGIVAYVLGSNRYASEDGGYVASLGVLPEHRGRGLARALLRARLADDAARGYVSTMLHVDATNPTGATALYESVGMAVDSEFVGFHRPLYG
jgi:ribosomal protein S18 acetylase RimI-like enzyme